MHDIDSEKLLMKKKAGEALHVSSSHSPMKHLFLRRALTYVKTATSEAIEGEFFINPPNMERVIIKTVEMNFLTGSQNKAKLIDLVI